MDQERNRATSVEDVAPFCVIVGVGRVIMNGLVCRQKVVAIPYVID